MEYFRNIFLNKKTVERFAREWDKAEGEKNIKAKKSAVHGDVIEISHDGASSNDRVNELLLQSGEIILENEMDNDLNDKK